MVVDLKVEAVGLLGNRTGDYLEPECRVAAQIPLVY